MYYDNIINLLLFLNNTYINIRMDHFWECFKCKSLLPSDMPTCSCDSEESTDLKFGQIICKICTYHNKPSNETCEICGENLGENKIQLPNLKPSTSLMNCPQCGFQNSLMNQTCLKCEIDLFQPEKDKQKIKCPICSFEVKKKNYDYHYNTCFLSSELIAKQQQEQEQDKKIPCAYCNVKFNEKQAKKHQPNCDKKPKMQNMLVDQKTRMTQLQMKAMKYMHQKSAKQHEATRQTLQKRIVKLGYKKTDLDNLQFYIENYAPIIIHIHISKHMQFFVKDTHYRSQFQTNKSSGSLSRTSRVQWEDRMFDKQYSKAKDFERVKYGTINFTNDPKGVQCCSAYGPSYLLLKPHVRERCTFTDKDSSNQNAEIGTFRYCFKVMNQLNDGELKAAIEGSRAMQVASNCVVTYKQIQIHGPVQFSKDVERIYVNKNQLKADKNLLDMVYQFSKNNGVDHDFI